MISRVGHDLLPPYKEPMAERGDRRAKAESRDDIGRVVPAIMHAARGDGNGDWTG